MNKVVVLTENNTLPTTDDRLEKVVVEYTDIVVVSNDSAQVVVTGLMGPPSRPKLYRYVYGPSLEWAVLHNNNTNRFIKRLMDLSNNEFFARVEIVSKDKFIVHLTEATAGYVDVIFDEQDLGEIRASS